MGFHPSVVKPMVESCKDWNAKAAAQIAAFSRYSSLPFTGLKRYIHTRIVKQKDWQCASPLPYARTMPVRRNQYAQQLTPPRSSA
jgi:hypothetical protein